MKPSGGVLGATHWIYGVGEAKAGWTAVRRILVAKVGLFNGKGGIGEYGKKVTALRALL